MKTFVRKLSAKTRKFKNLDPFRNHAGTTHRLVQDPRTQKRTHFNVLFSLVYRTKLSFFRLFYSLVFFRWRDREFENSREFNFADQKFLHTLAVCPPGARGRRAPRGR